MTEDDVRRIVREEIERAKEPPSYRGFTPPKEGGVYDDPARQNGLIWTGPVYRANQCDALTRPVSHEYEAWVEGADGIARREP